MGDSRESAGDGKRDAGRFARAVQALRRVDRSPSLVRTARATRELLPGDSELGDELTTAGDRPSQILARYLAETGDRTSATREVGLTALQVWQALSESTGRGWGSQEVAVLFTDLVDFSAWALDAGDELALELLREVAAATEPTVKEKGGQIVKRLGDGHMAVFRDSEAAVSAALRIQERVAAIDVRGHRPTVRAGVHSGRPRKVGGDYLGVDVNIAARVAQAADGGEVLVSEAALAGLDADALEVKRLRRFRAKGAPRELKVFAVTRR
jgi:adenylate cyclase